MLVAPLVSTYPRLVGAELQSHKIHQRGHCGYNSAITDACSFVWTVVKYCGVSLHRPGFDPNSICVGFFCVQAFVIVLRFPLSVSFHQCSILFVLQLMLHNIYSVVKQRTKCWCDQFMSSNSPCTVGGNLHLHCTCIIA